MSLRCSFFGVLLILLAVLNPDLSTAQEVQMNEAETEASAEWRDKAVAHARIMSQVTWTPVNDSMPIRGGGHFEKGTEYTGVPYSSVKSVGRYIGFDIFLKTFLAAVENPRSVLYTENLAGEVTNAATYYGKVCSSYTSYALQCGIWYVSRLHGPRHRDGIMQVEPASAQTAEVGDIIFTPPSPGSHVEIVTGITRDEDGKVTRVRVEDSWPPTTRTIKRSESNFNAHISSRGRELYRITDLNDWRGDNKAELFRFPNYAEDSATPAVNRVLLLDRGDWVPYYKQQPVKINIMDRDSEGVERLVIQHDGHAVEEIKLQEAGVIERSFASCGDYTAHCVMNDGSRSQECEFSVCDIDFADFPSEVTVNEPWEIGFTSSDNMDAVIVHLSSEENSYARYAVFITEQERRSGRVGIPADLVQDTGNWQVWLIGENRYGRLKKCRDVTAVE